MVNNIYVSVITGVIGSIGLSMIIGVAWCNFFDKQIEDKRNDRAIRTDTTNS